MKIGNNVDRRLRAKKFIIFMGVRLGWQIVILCSISENDVVLRPVIACSNNVNMDENNEVTVEESRGTSSE